MALAPDPERANEALRGVEDGFARACEACSPRVFHVDLAGRLARLRIAGEALAESFDQAFGHLARPGIGRGSELSIDFWDERETGIASPEAPALASGWRHWEVDGGRLDASTDGGTLCFDCRGTVAWLDRSARRIVGSCGSAALLTQHQRAKPLQLLLTVWCNDLGVHLTHAGCVARGEDGLLIGGRSGSGKSTTSLVALAHGFGFLADDCVALAVEEPSQFVAHSIFGSAFLHPQHLGRFPALEASAIHASRSFERKSIVFLSRTDPEGLVRRARVRGLLLPRVTDGSSSRLREARPAEALLAMAPNSLLGMRPRLGRSALDRLGNLVERVPAFWLDAGSDFTGVACCLDEALARSRASDGPQPDRR